MYGRVLFILTAVLHQLNLHKTILTICVWQALHKLTCLASRCYTIQSVLLQWYIFNVYFHLPNITYMAGVTQIKPYLDTRCSTILSVQSG